MQWNSSWKRYLRLNKRATFFDPGHLGDQRKVEIEYPPYQKFLTLLIQIKKNIFFQKGHFLTKRLIPGRFIFVILKFPQY